jgi:hypothetical protein
MSVAHNFQNNDTDNKHLHSLLSSAKFTFTIDKKRYVFSSAENRMAFIHHLQPGDEVAPRNMDIALVKLGIQTNMEVGMVVIGRKKNNGN